MSINELLRQGTENQSMNYFNLVISGEDGVGKEYYARKVHKFRRGKENFLMFDFEMESTAQEIAVETLTRKNPEEFIQNALTNTLFFRRFDFLEDYLILRIQDFLRKVISLRIDKKIHFLELGILCSVDESLASQTNKIIASVLQEFFVLKVFIPPLRERTVELLDVIKEIFHDFDLNHRENILKVASKAKDLLAGYSWPGNLNQLRSVLEEASLILEKNGSNLESYFEKKFSNNVICSSSNDNTKDFSKENKGSLEKCLSGIVCCTFCS